MKNQQELDSSVTPFPIENYQSLKKLPLFEAYCHCLQDNYNPKTNPTGYVNFGMSINNLAPKITIKYLPTYITLDDFAYPNSFGLDQQLNKMMAQGTIFSWKESIVFNSMSAIVSTLCKRYKKLCFIGQVQKIKDLNTILDHSNYQITSNQNSNLIIVSYPNKSEDICKIRQICKDKLVLYIFNCKKQMVNLFGEVVGDNQIFVYEHQIQIQKAAVLGVAHTKNMGVFQHLSDGWNYFPTNNLLKRICLNPKLLQQSFQTEYQQPYKNITNGDDLSIIRKTIQKINNIQIDKQYLFLTIGATSGLNHISRALFMNNNNQNNKILYTDSPYYTGFDYDFKDGGVQIKSKSMWDSRKAIQRIKQAYEEQGVVGYVICNPNNPVGTVLSPEQIKQICQWVIDKPQFHLIFDQMYINLVLNKQSTISSSIYSIKYSNIHTVRGFAKDIGICGFNIGITISYNPKIKQKFNKWRNIMGHQSHTISIINHMLIKSDYGQQIIKEVRLQLISCLNKIFQILDRQKIKYIKPQGGCFIFVDLREHLRESTIEEQNRLWKKLFYKYRINVSSGSSYHSVYPGFYRVSPVAEESIMVEGLKRLAAAIKDKD